MNRFQKRIMIIAAGLGNISLCLTAAAVATYAWFTANTAATITTDADGVDITTTPPNNVESWEILKFDYEDKVGKTYSEKSEFYLQKYDHYLSGTNIYTNAILHATINVDGYDDTKQLYVDVDCDSGHEPTYNATVPAYTSNICQFKSFVYSYTTDQNRTVTVNNAITASTAATRYNTATTYFKNNIPYGESFLVVNNSTPNKRYTSVTSVPKFIPELDTENGETKVTKVEVYVECSYNESLVDYYANKLDLENPAYSLEGDINKIEFDVRDQKYGSYVKVTNQDQLDEGGDYLITYDDQNAAFDGNRIGSTLNPSTTGNSTKNYIPVHQIGGRIAHNENTDKSSFLYSSTGENPNKLVTKQGDKIGPNTGDGNGMVIDSTQTNNLTYNSGHVDITAQTTDQEPITKALRYNDGKQGTLFRYYTSGQKAVSMYKLNESAEAGATLAKIAVTSPKTSYYVGDLFQDPKPTVTATYTDGLTANVTASANFDGFDSSTAANQQQITVSYTEDGITRQTTYKVDIINAPKVTLDQKAVTGFATNPAKTVTLTATTQYFEGNVSYTWDTSNSSVATVTNEGGVATITLKAVGTATITVTASSDVVGEPDATDTCSVTVNEIKNCYATIVPSDFPDSNTSNTPLSKDGTNGTTLNVVSNNVKKYNSVINMDKAGSYIYSTNELSLQSLVFDFGTYGTTQFHVYGGNQVATGGSTSNFTEISVNQDSVTYDLSSYRYFLIVYDSGSAWGNINSITVNYSNFIKQLTSISVDTSEATKLTYYVGDASLNTEGIVVTANYDDGTHADVSSSAAVAYTGFSASSAGQKTITVTYTEHEISKTDDFNITVEAVKLSSISVSGGTRQFYVGDTIVCDVTVTAHYNNGTQDTVTSGVSSDAGSIDTSTAGNKTVTVSYTEGDVTKTATYTVNVKVDEIDTIAIKTQPTNLTYNSGDSFDDTGMTLTATYESGATDTITSGWTVNKTTLSYSDNNTAVTVTYSGKTCSTNNLTVHEQSVELSQTSVSAEVGDSAVTLTATPHYFSGTVSYTWTSNNTSVVTVSGNGSSCTVTIVGAGNATVTCNAAYSAKSQSASATCTFSVTTGEATLTSLTVTPDPITINGLNTQQITIVGNFSDNSHHTYTTSELSSDFLMESNDESICTISDTGLITAQGLGTTTIYILAPDGNTYAEVSVTVTDVTYTFTSKSWADSQSEWNSGIEGYQYSGGVQITKNETGAGATSKGVYTNVAQIVVHYHTNTSSGAGSISVQVGENSSSSKSVTSTGGSSSRTLTWTYSPNQSGNISFEVTCTTNSIYIEAVEIFYQSVAHPSLSIDPTSLSLTVGSSNGTITATASGGTGSVTFTSGNTSVASVANVNGNVASIHPEAAGSTVITVSYSGVSVTCSVAVSNSQAVETLIYTLDGTTTGGSNGYATTSEITQGDLSWDVIANTTISPWRFGGKNISDELRTCASTTTVSSYDITKVVVNVGSATATVNSVILYVGTSQGNNDVSELSLSFSASSALTFNRPSGDDWSDCYFTIIFDVTCGGSNQYVQLQSAQFYAMV